MPLPSSNAKLYTFLFPSPLPCPGQFSCPGYAIHCYCSFIHPLSLPASVLRPLHTGGSQIRVSRRVATTNNRRPLRLCIPMLFHPLPYETSYTIFLALVMLSCSWFFVYTGPPPGNVLSPLTSLAGLWFAIRSRVLWSHLSPESTCGEAPTQAFFVSPIRSFAALCCPSPSGVVRLISFSAL